MARVTNVGGGYLKRIAATKAKGQDPSEIQRKYNLKLENFAAVGASSYSLILVSYNRLDLSFEQTWRVTFALLWRMLVAPHCL